MKLLSFERPDGTTSYGTTDGRQIFDAGRVMHDRFPDLLSALRQDAISDLYGTGEPIAFDDVRLLPPVPNSGRILCIGLNYLPHILESGRPRPEYPSIFTRHPDSLVGHGSPIVRPKVSREFDYEGELAVIIGRAGRHITAQAAMDHVLGYAPANEGSVRDFQNHTTQFWPGKNFEHSGAVGPWIVTQDEVGDIRNQTLRTRVNGAIEQESLISDLAFSIPEIIAYASQVATLHPGDMILTGTPGGVGRYREPQLYLEPGMEVEVEVTGVGTLKNAVIGEDESHT